ncbi:Craniofacial development protein 2 [Eumeta japonica]|uniref:Craniofacial development protein 2 n=1 Tax=Eumeta variegata TaxID=151549 RepID=A0A4C1Y6T7_EUMVA|nr:Craniofacial development protein 2 [Eumeta japonica]
MGISEVRRLGNKIEEYDNFIFCYIGQTPGKHGAGFIINKSLKSNIESFTGLSERVATLNINIGDNKISIIQIYAPTDTASDYEIDTFYKTIETAIESAHKHIILMGDFNAKIGAPKDTENCIMKQYGYGVRNDRGQRLIDFALENKLTIINTCFKKKENRRWTWRSPTGQYKNEIDYILSNQPSLFENIEVINLNYPSDHRPVRATLKLSKQKTNRTKFTNKQKGSKTRRPTLPILFIAILENIIGKLDWRKLGLCIKGAYLNHLRFADDLVLLSETASEMQLMIETLHNSSTKVGLEMNLTKLSLTYGCQTWKFSTIATNKINTCQRGLERSMLKIKKLDKIRHTKIRETTKATNALTYAQKLKWKWAGHIARLTDQRWTSRVTRWTGPPGKRRPGRPLSRWEDDIKRTAGTNWRLVAQDRDKWKSLEEACTQKGSFVLFSSIARNRRSHAPTLSTLTVSNAFRISVRMAVPAAPRGPPAQPIESPLRRRPPRFKSINYLFQNLNSNSC